MIKGMIKSIFEWTNKVVAQNLKPETKKNRWKKPIDWSNWKKNRENKKNKLNENVSWINDPSFPDLKITNKVVDNPILPMNAIGDKPGRYKLGTIQQQAKSLKIIINSSLSYLSERSPIQIKNWRGANILNLSPRAGEDINAYYDRHSLKFFYFTDDKINKKIFTCDSRSVVTHEFGHAFLDILRPDWWDVQSFETWAFHEAFGDIVSIISSLEFDEMIDRAIKSTNGNLMQSNIITRIAAEMGTGLYNVMGGKDGELSNCLRDASVIYNYVSPSSLPAQGRYDVLTRSSHSFSRVFSGAFWELIVEVANFEKNNGKSLKEGVKIARNILTEYLLRAIAITPNTNKLFNAIAKAMLQIDSSNNNKYQSVLKKVFENRSILIPNVSILSNLSIDSLLKDLKDPYEVHTLGSIKIVKTTNQKTIKLSDNLNEIQILNDNPLFKLEISVPDQKSYTFENDNIIEIEESSEQEIIDSAFSCVDYLNKNKLVGNDDFSIFEEKNGKLVRKQIACSCGCKKNYCDPGAPEYNKPWKPANNSGCVSCKGNCLPTPCNPLPNPIVTKTKYGCYTTIKNANGTTHKYGNSISRRVC